VGAALMSMSCRVALAAGVFIRESFSRLKRTGTTATSDETAGRAGPAPEHSLAGGGWRTVERAGAVRPERGVMSYTRDPSHMNRRLTRTLSA
jgi:hypothetical protein